LVLYKELMGAWCYLGLRYSEGNAMRKKLIGYNIVACIILIVGVCLSIVVALSVDDGTFLQIGIFLVGLGFSFVLSLAPRVADQWEKGVVLRLGKFRGLKGPGLFWVIPFIDRVVSWIDLRIRTTGFAAEKTLTEDTVPINVDAVLFWVVTDAEKAALGVQSYENAVAWAAQTALRDIMGKTMLADILVGREMIDEQLRKLIDERTHAWGIAVNSVEIRDVVIPPDLEDAMSRQAQAEREKQARVILGDAEVEIADKFENASLKYRENPMAFQLRAMNMLYEGMKERGSLVVIPSSITESLNAAAQAGFASPKKAVPSEARES
jgi:regulator of protease activity HflC (stomatin/prohibitin superfamily)